MSKIPPDVVESFSYYDPYYCQLNGQGKTGNGFGLGTDTVRAERHLYSGGKTEHYRKVVREKGLLPYNRYLRADSIFLSDVPYTVQEFRNKNGDYFWYTGFRTWPELGFAITGSLEKYLSLEISKLMPEDDRVNLVNRAIDKCNKSVDIGPFIGGLVQVRGMVLSLMRRFLTLIQTVARHKGGSSKSVGTIIDEALRALRIDGPKGLSRLYLEIIYGWRPLVEDLQKIILHIRRVLNNVEVKPLVFGRGQGESTAMDVNLTMEHPVASHGAFTTDASFQLTIKGNAYSSQHALASGFSKITVPTLSVMPLKTLWDLTPFSFVLDWFLNMSSVFGALEVGAYANVTQACICSAQGWNVTAELSVIQRAGDQNAFNTFTNLHVVGKATFVSDVVIRRLTPPSANLPKVKPLAALGHLTEITALIISLTSKGR